MRSVVGFRWVRDCTPVFVALVAGVRRRCRLAPVSPPALGTTYTPRRGPASPRHTHVHPATQTAGAAPPTHHTTMGISSASSLESLDRVYFFSDTITGPCPVRQLVRFTQLHTLHFLSTAFYLQHCDRGLHSQHSGFFPDQYISIQSSARSSACTITTLGDDRMRGMRHIAR